MMKKLTQIWTKKPIVQAIALALCLGAVNSVYAQTVPDYKGSGKEATRNIGNTGSVLIGPDNTTQSDNYAAPYTNIIIGRGAFGEQMYGNQERSTFNTLTPSGTFVMGHNAYARTAGLNIGNKTYKSAIGGLDSVPTTTQNAKIMNYTLLGSNSYSNGAFASVMGSYNIVPAEYNGSNWSTLTKNFSSTTLGTLNSIRSVPKTGYYSNYSGMANALIGIANIAEQANGSLIFGAGNTIKNSYTRLSYPGSITSVDDAVDKFIGLIKGSDSAGSTMAFGGGNEATGTLRTSIIGVNNTIQSANRMASLWECPSGTSFGTNNPNKCFSLLDWFEENPQDPILVRKRADITDNNFVSGVNNTVTGARFSTVIGSNNQLTMADNALMLGNYRAVEGTADNPVEHVIAIGSVDAKNNTINEDKKITTSGAAAIGHNAYVDPASQGTTAERAAVALGENSVAHTAAGQMGYNPETKAVYDPTNDAITPAQDISVWQATADAISVGDTENGITRQINGVAAGTEDTDAINVAQLKRAKAAITEIADTQLKPKIAGDDNIVVTAAQDQTTPSEYTVGLADDLQLNTMIVGDNQEVVIDNQGINIGQDQVIINDQGVFVANGPTITEDGIDANDQVVSDVADGVDETDAINVRQLNTVSQSVSAINASIFDIEQTIQDSRRELRGIGANIGALMGLPQVMQPGKAMFAASAGAYKGEYSFAVGWSRGSDNGKSIFKISASVNTVKDVSVNLGFGFQF